MKAVLLRTGSVPVHHHSIVPGSPRLPASPRISLVNRRTDSTPAKGIRRVSSESNVIRSQAPVSGGFSALSGVGSRSFPARIPEEEIVSDDDEGVGGVGSLILDDFERRNYAGDWPESGIPVEELGFPGGGIGMGRNYGNGGGGNADRSKIRAYYEEMLKSNPTNSLLLRNYSKFLHEVEGDMVKAEEFYGRAILASPGDGEVLCLYGKLIWETQRDEDRANFYFDQAILASPNDCTVLGMYARFMWEADLEEDGDGGSERENGVSMALAAMVEVF